MKKQKIILSYKGKKKVLELYKVPWWKEGIGLMFSNSKNSKALLFSFKKEVRMGIFSLFIPFNFLAIWLDKDKNIIEKKIISRGEIGVKPVNKFKYLIEIPVTEKYDEILGFLDERRKV